MATSILRLSDGVVTIDFQSANFQVLTGGVDLSPPVLQQDFISSPFVDGNRLANARYANRTIAISLLIKGANIGDLQTSIRSIQRLLNDARKRLLLGYGNKVYLEYQWGVVAGQSVYFDVNSGELILPRDFSSFHLWKDNLIVGAQLVLNCMPFGRYTNQDYAQQTLENNQSTKDITISYLVDDDGGLTLDSTNDWVAQTFTTIGAFTAIAGAFKVYRDALADTPGTITIAIYATAAGKPSGAALATGTIDGTYVTATAGAADWVVVIFDTPVALSATTKYALVIHADGVGVGDELLVRVDLNDGAFANGSRWFSADAGVNWEETAGDDCVFAIYKAISGDANYMDVTTAEAYGDVPARLYTKIDLTGAIGTKKVFIAKRTGTRQTDDLWIEGEDFNSFTDIIAGAHAIGGFDSLEDDSGNDMVGRGMIIPSGGNIAASTAAARFNYTIMTVPVGWFKVIARIRVTAQDSNDYDHLAFGVGWSYGAKTKAPTIANGDYHSVAANSTWEVLDLGELILPPIAGSNIAANSSIELRLFVTSINDVLTQNEYYKFDVDWIFLLPIDEGVVILDMINTDIIAIDGITTPPNVFRIVNDKVTDYPGSVGAPFSLGRENTRLYVLRDDVASVTFTVDVKYQPQFLVV